MFAHAAAVGNRYSLSALPASLSTSERFFSSSRFMLSSYERECFEKAWPFIVQQCEILSVCLRDTRNKDGKAQSLMRGISATRDFVRVNTKVLPGKKKWNHKEDMKEL